MALPGVSGHEQRLKSAVHFTVGKMCEEQGDLLKVTYSKEVAAAATELVWRSIKIWTKDLEAFARHAKRSTLSVDDVKLLVRRNDSLKERLVDAFQQAAGSAPATKGRGSKKKADAEDADPNFS